MRLSFLILSAAGQECNTDDQQTIEAIDPSAFGSFFTSQYEYYFGSDGIIHQKDLQTNSQYLLGHYDSSSWNGESKTLTRFYNNGQLCPNGRPREVTVVSKCGDETKLNSVKEPIMCEYVWDITVACCELAPVPTPLVNRCNNDEGEMILDVAITGMAESPGDDWTDAGGNTYTRVYNPNDVIAEFVENDDGKFLYLKKQVLKGEIEGCEGFVNQDNQKVCFDAQGVAYVFTCIYDLSDQTLEDNYVVGPANITIAEATGSGTVNYVLEVEEEVAMGDVINFQIIPKTPGIIFATVKSCTVKQGVSNTVPIFGFNDKPMCFLEPAEAGWTNDPSSKITIDGYWRSFQWYDNGVLDKEPQSLACTIGLSENKNPDTPEACDFSG